MLSFEIRNGDWIVEPNPVVESIISSDPDGILQRYVAKHRLDPSQPLTLEMVKEHYYLERHLAASIMKSSREDRARVAEAAYDQFYKTCFWLNAWKIPASHDPTEFDYFINLLGPSTKRIYEVGSGTGGLAHFLARKGYECVATEISSERRTSADTDSLVWHSTDGVHIADYEPESWYDAVVSMQVLEHLHPDDIEEHCRHVLRVLKPGGKYILTTPNRISGPRDVTQLFGLDESDCFHLKEYTHAELAQSLRSAGFSHVSAVYLPPRKLRQMYEFGFASRAYLAFVVGLEKCLMALPVSPRRKVSGALHKIGLWRFDVFLIAVKA